MTPASVYLLKDTENIQRIEKELGYQIVGLQFIVTENRRGRIFGDVFVPFMYGISSLRTGPLEVHSDDLEQAAFK